jgi:RNA polymerase sigma factor (sigma-70 family)
MSDQQILHLISSNKDDRALLKLYKFYPKIEHFLITHGASKEEALDVYQDALYMLCKKVKEGNFTLTAQLSTYLYSVCKFMWKDALVKKNKTVRFEFDAHDESVDYLDEEEDKISSAEKALESLGEKCWEILKAFYHEGLSMAKIAVNFGFSSEKSAKSQKFKCLEKAKLKYAELNSSNLNS